MIRKGYVDTREGQIHYQTAGEKGDYLVMLHQTPTSSDEYTRLMPLLAERFRVYAMDTPGYGQSYIPSRKLEIEEYVDNVVNFMDAIGIDKTHLYGHHTGAILSVELATTRPERVLKMVLSGSPGWNEEARMAQLNHPAYHHVVLDDEGQFLMRKWGLYKAFCAPGAKAEVWFPAFCASVLSGTRTHDGHVAAFKYDILKRYPKLNKEVLLISGDRDEFLPELESTAKLMPNCKTKVVKGGTIVSLEEPVEVAQAILGFI